MRLCLHVEFHVKLHEDLRKILATIFGSYSFGKVCNIFKILLSMFASVSMCSCSKHMICDFSTALPSLALVKSDLLFTMKFHRIHMLRISCGRVNWYPHGKLSTDFSLCSWDFSAYMYNLEHIIQSLQHTGGKCMYSHGQQGTIPTSQETENRFFTCLIKISQPNQESSVSFMLCPKLIANHTPLNFYSRSHTSLCCLNIMSQVTYILYHVTHFSQCTHYVAS